MPRALLLSLGEAAARAQASIDTDNDWPRGNRGCYGPVSSSGAGRHADVALPLIVEGPP